MINRLWGISLYCVVVVVALVAVVAGQQWGRQIEQMRDSSVPYSGGVGKVF